MSPLNTNIRHGNLSVKIRHGGGSDLAGLIEVIVPVVACVIACVVIIEYIWWIIAAAGIYAVARGCFAVRKAMLTAARDTEMTMAFAQEHERREVEAAKALAAQRAHEIEVARASAPVIQPVIQNIIDPAALLAAAFAAPHPAPYRAEVVRAEVER